MEDEAGLVAAGEEGTIVGITGFKWETVETAWVVTALAVFWGTEEVLVPYSELRLLWFEIVGTLGVGLISGIVGTLGTEDCWGLEEGIACWEGNEVVGFTSATLGLDTVLATGLTIGRETGLAGLVVVEVDTLAGVVGFTVLDATGVFVVPVIVGTLVGTDVETVELAVEADLCSSTDWTVGGVESDTDGLATAGCFSFAVSILSGWTFWSWSFFAYTVSSFFSSLSVFSLESLSCSSSFFSLLSVSSGASAKSAAEKAGALIILDISFSVFLDTGESRRSSLSTTTASTGTDSLISVAISFS